MGLTHYFTRDIVDWLHTIKDRRVFMTRKLAFTLAEVLITLAIVGVVAAMTLTPFIIKITNVVRQHQITVIEKKLVDSLNLYNSLENGLSGKTHENTEEFLKGLSKYYKITSICGADNIKNCFPYKNINYTIASGEMESKEISKIKETSDLHLSSDYLAPAGFITASGVPFIISLKKNCILDPDAPLKNLSDAECIAGLYDLNGANKPNRLGAGYDIVSFNGANIGIYTIINGIRISEKAKWWMKGLNGQECEIEKNKNYGIKYCPSYEWGGAMKYCHEQNAHLPSPQELAQIISGFYVHKNTGAYPQIGAYDDWNDDNYTQNWSVITSLNMVGHTGNPIANNNLMGGNTILSNEDLESNKVSKRFFGEHKSQYKADAKNFLYYTLVLCVENSD